MTVGKIVKGCENQLDKACSHANVFLIEKKCQERRKQCKLLTFLQKERFTDNFGENELVEGEEREDNFTDNSFVLKTHGVESNTQYKLRYF
jgi:hypothetical protein